MKGDWGILEFFRIRHSWQNVHPLGWILFFAVIAVIVGFLVNGVDIIMKIGGFIILIFVIYFIVWAIDQ